MRSTFSFSPAVAAPVSHVRRSAKLQASPSRVAMKTRAAAAGEAVEEEQVTIRRRPPQGIDSQGCGPVDFRVPSGEENKPRNVLEEIVWYKAVEIEAMRKRVPLAMLSSQVKSAPPPRDFIGALRSAAERTGRPGLIAEVKKASPSRGVIQPNFDPVKIAQSYEEGGAACLSVLTDRKYFQGGFENLQKIRAAGVACPLLCKEFIVEAYQIYKARASGADAVLLITGVLPNSDMAYLIKVAQAVGLQCLIEVHTVGELRRVLKLPSLDGCMLGINNRDLETFTVDLGNTEAIMSSPEGEEVKARNLFMAGESGIFTFQDVARVQAAGCGAILVGESLVKQGNPAEGVKALLQL